MKSCERELQVVAHAIGGELPESLLRHLEACPLCSEAVTAIRKLQLLADEPFAAPLPSAASVWWKATVQKQQDAERHTRIPLICMEWIGYAVGLLSAIALVIRAAPVALSLSPLLWIGLGIIGTTCFLFACTLYAWSRWDS
jgi:hypothetical protein